MRPLVRNRWSSLHTGPGRQLLFWALEPSAFVMEQGTLRGIKQRAESGGRTGN